MNDTYICALCPRNCNAARTNTRGGGVCKAPLLPRVASAAPHFGEEPPLVGTRGSGAIFFTNCALRCVYCQNHPITMPSDPNELNKYTRHDAPSLLAIMDRLHGMGAHNINLVNATPYLPAVIDALSGFGHKLPVVYNTSGYETIETIDKLAAYVDIWLPDFKYASSRDSMALSSVADYPTVAIRAIKRMREISGGATFDGGVMTRGTIVRHLILPHRIKESIDALNVISENLPNTHVSLMGQYTPMPNAAAHGLNATISKRAYDIIVSHRNALGLNLGWNQPPSASGAAMIPRWETM